MRFTTRGLNSDLLSCLCLIREMDTCKILLLTPFYSPVLTLTMTIPCIALTQSKNGGISASRGDDKLD
jgi:hypothetical protein